MKNTGAMTKKVISSKLQILTESWQLTIEKVLILSTCPYGPTRDANEFLRLHQGVIEILPARTRDVRLVVRPHHLSKLCHVVRTVRVLIQSDHVVLLHREVAVHVVRPLHRSLKDIRFLRQTVIPRITTLYFNDVSDIWHYRMQEMMQITTIFVMIAAVNMM